MRHHFDYYTVTVTKGRVPREFDVWEWAGDISMDPLVSDETKAQLGSIVLHLLEKEGILTFEDCRFLPWSVEWVQWSVKAQTLPAGQNADSLHRSVVELYGEGYFESTGFAVRRGEYLELRAFEFGFEERREVARDHQKYIENRESKRQEVEVDTARDSLQGVA